MAGRWGTAVDSLSAERLAAERWFLQQGLPAVLRRGALLHRVWIRSTPALAGLAVIAANSILIVALSGQHTVDIAGRPDLLESFVLLTFLVFFNTYVWLMTSLISRGRLWLGIGFLMLVAGSFLVATTVDQISPLLSGSSVPRDAPALSGTPFDRIPDPPHTDRLSLTERLNVVFVVAASQLVHVLAVAMLTGAIYVVLGMILVSPTVLDAWTRGTGRPDGELAGMTLPIPEALIQTTMLLTAITFMYLAAKAVTDAEYRAQFVDPMLDTLKQTLRARARYRASRDAHSAHEHRAHEHRAHEHRREDPP